MVPTSGASSREKQRVAENVRHGLQMASSFAYNYTDWDRGEFGHYLGTFGEEDAELLPYAGGPAWSPDGSEIACSISHQFGARLTFINVPHTKVGTTAAR